MSINAKSLAQAKAQVDAFTAEVFIKGLPNGDGQTSAENTEIVVTDANEDKQSQAVACLFCRKEIE